MKLFSISATVIVLLIFANSHGNDIFEEQARQNRIMLENQKKDNEKRQNDIIKKLDSFLATINFRIKDKDAKIPPLTSPVKSSFIQDIVETDHTHATEKETKPLYAYINSSEVNMRSDGSIQSKKTGMLQLNEKIELLEKSDSDDTIDNYSSPWILVKREDGTMGWVFGKYISARQTSFKKTGNEKDTKKHLLAVPARGKVTSTFGYRTDPVTREKGSFHSGIDIAAPRGTAVHASAGGKVIRAGYHRGGYGNLVIIQHSGDLCTYYGHLAKITVAKGQSVSRGRIIGSVGSTGKTTGPHLHFEVRRGDKAMDPDSFFH